MKISRYNKAIVPLVMGLLYFLNTYFGIQLPVDEQTANTIFIFVTSFFTYLVPNANA